ncbi:hypothetical protein 2 [Hubei sobemo-like virus 24]|uniref:hypothetical protein 2 n=1 Tax=Hubei sobemo-like virus 24 TaxID=1923210 RepID=UPI00090BAC0F|nr:hypothetical protein 2 [Hubei sobemo-like virus 24]APG75925.1 hypothetical protein 2 [Hubei sobemo-like virus 24]
MKSLAIHSAMHKGLRTDPPSDVQEDEILEWMARIYPRWEIPSDFMQYTHYQRVLRGLDWTSSPGYPYLLTSPTNSQLFQVVDGEPAEAPSRAIWEIVQKRLVERDADPIRLFVKPEPHKLKKIEEGRFRLISSVSVVDQIIDHMLHDDYDQVMIENWATVPPKAGWTPLLGGWKTVPNFLRPLAVDKKAWDWTVRPWLLSLSLRHRIRQCSNMCPLWEDLAEWRWRMLYAEAVFVTSGGILLKQKEPGVRKSGCVTTLSDNSLEQDILHRRISLDMWRKNPDLHIPPLWGSMGDDTIQEEPDNLDEYLGYLSQYCIVKEAVRSPDFAGFSFHGRDVKPLYLGKHAYQLLHVDPAVKDGVARSYALLYHRAPAARWISRMCRMLGDVPTEVRLDSIYDGE